MSETRDGQRHYDTSYQRDVAPITEHPDVQRLIAETVKLQAENKKLKDAVEKIIDYEVACKLKGVGYDIFVHDRLVEALVF